MKVHKWWKSSSLGDLSWHVCVVCQVTGPSGCGKTQLCIMLSVLATLPRSMGGLDSGVIFIDTESAFSAERCSKSLLSFCHVNFLCFLSNEQSTSLRLVEMAQARFPEFFSVKERLLEMASRVHLFRELTCQDVLNRLEHFPNTYTYLIIFHSVYCTFKVIVHLKMKPVVFPFYSFSLWFTPAQFYLISNFY